MCAIITFIAKQINKHKKDQNNNLTTNNVKNILNFLKYD